MLTLARALMLRRAVRASGPCAVCGRRALTRFVSEGTSLEASKVVSKARHRSLSVEAVLRKKCLRKIRPCVVVCVRRPTRIWAIMEVEVNEKRRIDVGITVVVLLRIGFCFLGMVLEEGYQGFFISLCSEGKALLTTELTGTRWTHKKPFRMVPLPWDLHGCCRGEPVRSFVRAQMCVVVNRRFRSLLIGR